MLSTDLHSEMKKIMLMTLKCQKHHTLTVAFNSHCLAETIVMNSTLPQVEQFYSNGSDRQVDQDLSYLHDNNTGFPLTCLGILFNPSTLSF